MARRLGDARAFAAALSFLPAALAAQSAPPATPGPWIVEYALAHCQVGRVSGTGRQWVSLALARTPSQSGLYVELVTDERNKHDAGPVQVNFVLDAKHRLGEVTLSGRMEPGGRVTRVWLDPATAAMLLRSDMLSIGAAGARYGIDFRGIGGAGRALAKCERDMLTHWGVDADEVAKVAASAHPAFGDTPPFGPDAYPKDALRVRAQGLSVAVLTIGPDGAVKACRIASGAAFASLDRATCQHLSASTVRFTPATDGSGSAIASLFVMPVFWVMPEDGANVRSAMPFGMIVTSR